MLQAGGDGNFPEKALRPECGHQLLAQDLESDQAAVLKIVGEIDNGHPTAAQLALDRVATGEGRLEAFEGLWQVS